MTPVTSCRRQFFVGISALAFAGTILSGRARGAAASPSDEISEIEREVGGCVGVAVLDTASGATIAHRADERFAMASTFKWTLAACVLQRVDRGLLTLDQPVPYGRAQLLSYAPVTTSHVDEGRLSVDELARAAVEVSDNTAANLLLDLCGGPAGLTGFLRAAGDPTTRLDRTEMTLNSNLPGDPRDTTTPAAMVEIMRIILLGHILTDAGKTRLIGWMKDCATGKERLRMGLPKSWVVGDKTGSGERGAINDLAIAWPPSGRPPVLVACYMSGSTAPLEKLNAAHARIGALIGRALA